MRKSIPIFKKRRKTRMLGTHNQLMKNFLRQKNDFSAVEATEKIILGSNCHSNNIIHKKRIINHILN